MTSSKDFWAHLREHPPSLEEVLASEPLLRHLDPDLVGRALGVLQEIATDADFMQADELVHLVVRGRLGPKPTLRLLIRACHRLAGRRVERLGFSKAFEPTPPSSRQVYETFRGHGKSHEDAA